MYKLNIAQLRKTVLVQHGTKLEHNRNDEKDFLPFPSREPERFKFKTSTNGIIGAYFRAFTKEQIPTKIDYAIKMYCCDENALYGDAKKREQLEVFLLNYLLDENKLLKLTDISLYKKLPLSTPMKLQKNRSGKIEEKVDNEGKGELLIATFLSQVFPLDSEMLALIQQENSNPVLAKLFEQLSIASGISDNQLNKKFAVFFNSLKELYLEDMKHLSKNKKYFMESFEYLLMHYYFTYISQFTLQCGDPNATLNENYGQFYSYETELTSKTRNCYHHGYQKLSKAKSNLFYNMILLTHLNFTEDQKAYHLHEIIEQMSQQDLHSLIEWIEDYMSVGKFNHENASELLEEFDGLKQEMNVEKMILFYRKCIESYYTKVNPGSYAAVSRYPKSLEEVAKRYFLKKRGNLGYMLNITQDFLVLMVAVCVKEEKMHIKNLFVELERRGIYLDRYSQEHILEVLDNLNLIIKQSDSGEVQYVKSIL